MPRNRRSLGIRKLDDLTETNNDMTRQEILERFQATLLMLLGLREDQFIYNHYVGKSDMENGCGTMCCIMGWYPKYLPESGLIWRLNHNQTDITVSFGQCGDPDVQLTNYHGISYDLMMAIFYGQSLSSPGVTHLNEIYLSEAGLKDAIERVQRVIELIETGEIDEHLRLDA